MISSLDLNNQKLNKESVVEGSLAPDFRLKSLGGDTVSLSKLKGRYVLLNFWASWAKTSANENSQLVEVYKKYKPYGFVFAFVLSARTYISSSILRSCAFSAFSSAIRSSTACLKLNNSSLISCLNLSLSFNSLSIFF